MDRETEGQGTRCPIVHNTEVFIFIAGMGWSSVSLVPKDLSVIEGSLYYRGQKLDGICLLWDKESCPY